MTQKKTTTTKTMRVVEPKRGYNKLTVCGKLELPADEDAVSILLWQEATCGQCMAILLEAKDLARD